MTLENLWRECELARSMTTCDPKRDVTVVGAVDGPFRGSVVAFANSLLNQRLRDLDATVLAREVMIEGFRYYLVIVFGWFYLTQDPRKLHL